MSRTTLLVPVLEARSLADPTLLEDGQPPHITLVFPFVDAGEVGAAVVAELERRFAAFPAFDFRLTHVVRFGEVLFVAPEPAQPFRDLLRAVAGGSPPPPYPVTVTDTMPHLTVARSTSAEELELIESRLSTELPIQARACEVWLMAERDAGWSLERAFALGPALG